MIEVEMSDELDMLVEWIHSEAQNYVPGDPLLVQFQGFCRGVICAGGRRLAAEERKRLMAEADRYLRAREYQGSLFSV